MTETDSSGRGHRGLIAVLAFSLLVRLAWGQWQSADVAELNRLPDQTDYLQLANNLLHGQGLRLYDPRFHAEAVAFRAPGYPIFLAACGGTVRIARAVQGVIDSSTVLAVYLLARRWLGGGTSLIAAVCVAVNTFIIYMSGLLLSETLFTAMLAWGMVLLVRNGWRPLLGAGVLALAVTVRPSAAGLPVLLMIAAAGLNRGRRGAYSRWWPAWWPIPPATTSLVLILAVLLPWAYRNDKLLGNWVWLTTNGGITAYDGFNDDATGASDQRFVAKTPGLRNAGEVQRDDYFADAARRWIRRHPGRAVRLAGVKIARTWSPLPLSAEYGRPLYRLAGLLYALPFDLLVILAFWRGRGIAPSLPGMAKAFLLVPAIYLTGVHALTVGSLRYRLPAEPPMAVVAALGASTLKSERRSRWRRAESLNDGV